MVISVVGDYDAVYSCGFLPGEEKYAPWKTPTRSRTPKAICLNGFRVVFLLGADFKMSTVADRNYAFEQGRTKHAVQHNNRLYHALDRRFAELRKRFRDFWVFNCTPDSGLKSLPYYRMQ